MAKLVYVVDDEAVISMTLAAILTRSGFEAVPFTNPMEALRVAETKSPDILITDVVMPELNGIDLAIQIKSKFPSCHVVLFSGQATTSDRLEKASRLGHDLTILTKPIHPKDLLAAISQRR